MSEKIVQLNKEVIKGQLKEGSVQTRCLSEYAFVYMSADDESLVDFGRDKADGFDCLFRRNRRKLERFP